MCPLNSKPCRRVYNEHMSGKLYICTCNSGYPVMCKYNVVHNILSKWVQKWVCEFLVAHSSWCQCSESTCDFLSQFTFSLLSLGHQKVFLLIVLEEASGGTGSGVAEGERGAGHLVRRSGGERGHRGPHATLRLSSLACKRKKRKEAKEKLKSAKQGRLWHYHRIFHTFFPWKQYWRLNPSNKV